MKGSNMFTLPFIFVVNMMMMPVTILQTATIKENVTVEQNEKTDHSIIPKIKKYDFPGQRSLVTVSTKCPTELVGVSTPSSLVFHEMIDGGMQMINRTQVLPIELQQVCT